MREPTNIKVKQEERKFQREVKEFETKSRPFLKDVEKLMNEFCHELETAAEISAWKVSKRGGAVMLQVTSPIGSHRIIFRAMVSQFIIEIEIDGNRGTLIEFPVNQFLIDRAEAEICKFFESVLSVRRSRTSR